MNKMANIVEAKVLTFFNSNQNPVSNFSSELTAKKNSFNLFGLIQCGTKAEQPFLVLVYKEDI
jgi:hypothetical protein